MHRYKKQVAMIISLFLVVLNLPCAVIAQQQTDNTDKIPEHDVTDWHAEPIKIKKEVSKKKRGFFSKYKWWILGGVVLLGGGVAAASGGGGGEEDPPVPSNGDSTVGW